MQEKILDSDKNLQELREEQLIIERNQKIDNSYKLFKKIVLVFTSIGSVIALLLGHKIGTDLSQDNKYKLDNEFDMFDDSQKENNIDEQSSQNINTSLNKTHIFIKIKI